MRRAFRRLPCARSTSAAAASTGLPAKSKDEQALCPKRSQIKKEIAKKAYWQPELPLSSAPGFWNPPPATARGSSCVLFWLRVAVMALVAGCGPTAPANPPDAIFFGGTIEQPRRRRPAARDGREREGWPDRRSWRSGRAAELRRRQDREGRSRRRVSSSPRSFTDARCAPLMASAKAASSTLDLDEITSIAAQLAAGGGRRGGEDAACRTDARWARLDRGALARGALSHPAGH